MKKIKKRSSSLSSEAIDDPSKNSSNVICYLLGDTSIDKACSNKTRADRLIQVVKNKESMLKNQRDVRKVTQKRRKIQEV